MTYSEETRNLVRAKVVQALKRTGNQSRTGKGVYKKKKTQKGD